MKGKILLFLFIVFIFIGKYIVVFISDTFQKEICADKICIMKPKGWIPVFVDRNDGSYFLNIINIGKDDLLENNFSQIMLNKNNKNITIHHSRFKSTHDKVIKRLKLKKFKYLSKIYYMSGDKNSSVTIYYPKNELSIYMSSFDKDILNKICSY